ncbi:MAG: hypothetical protein QY328_02320 [Anaerolineales bacterium]|jgi:hypothetical protein|nr:hypothetical protein [Anaerolineales bacterium]WKZ40874.1 MAG: hypothetical protein QY328_02320 [Anaerolineales bacterium]
METSKLMIGALIFIVLVIGINLVMYAMVRGAFRSDGKGAFDNFSKSLTTSTKKQNEPINELRRRVEELHAGKKDASSDSEQ